MAALHRNGPYWTLWRTPRIRGQACFGLLAQLTQGAAPIGVVLLVRQETGSFATAGAVSAAFWIAAAVARPIQGRLIDRRGIRAVMLAAGPVHAAALIGLVLAARAGSGAAVLVVIGATAGLGLPPVSSTMRVDWGSRLPAEERTAAYSLVFLTQELALLTGPLLVAAMVAIGSASLALVVAASISGAAAIAYAAMTGDVSRPRAHPQQRGTPRSTAMPTLMAVTFLLGATIGALQVATPAVAVARGVPAVGGVLIAALSVGGIAGALLYGGRRWALDPSVRLLGLLCIVGVAATALAGVAAASCVYCSAGYHAPTLVVVGVLLGCVGLAVNPALTTTSLLVDRHRAARSAEGFGWMSTAVGGGTAAGSAAAGALAQHSGVGPAFLAAAAAAYGAVLVAAIARTRLRRDPADPGLVSVPSRV